MTWIAAARYPQTKQEPRPRCRPHCDLLLMRARARCPCSCTPVSHPCQERQCQGKATMRQPYASHGAGRVALLEATPALFRHIACLGHHFELACTLSPHHESCLSRAAKCCCHFHHPSYHNQRQIVLPSLDRPRAQSLRGVASCRASALVLSIASRW